MTDIVWRGVPVLEPFLVPITTLEPFPDNPRRGDSARTAESLRRFGQLKPIVTDGNRIVAGHHVVQGATSEGWTHIAAVSHGFADEDEQRAFMLADNRASDFSFYDEELLVRHLNLLAENDSLAGTGYSGDDIDEMLAGLHRRLEDTPIPTEPLPQSPISREMKDIVLVYSPDQHAQVEAWIRVIAKANGTEGVSETVYAALEFAATAASV